MTSVWKKLPRDDGKYCPYPPWEHLYNELYIPAAASNANVPIPTYYALVHPFLTRPIQTKKGHQLQPIKELEIATKAKHIYDHITTVVN